MCSRSALVVLQVDAAGETSLAELAADLSATATRLSGCLELAGTLEDLEEAGYLERVNAGGSMTVRLTAAGRERAARLRDDLAEETVRLEDGGEVTVAAAADRTDRTVAAVLAERSAEGGVDERGDLDPERRLGHDRAREVCRERLARILATGRSEMIAISGPPGVGKTTVADWLADRAAERSVSVARARVHADGGPYQPLRDLLADLDVDVDTVFGTAASGVTADDPETLAAQQATLFGDLADVLARGGEDGPRLLVLDDLHLADPGTIDFVEYWAERGPECPALLVATVRANETGDGWDVADLFDADRDRRTHAELTPFDLEETRGLVEYLVGRPDPPDPLLSVVQEHTGGIPLFVEATVETLLETGALDPHYEWYPEEPGAIDVPAAVETTVDSRLAEVDPAARELLRWAATIGEQVPVAVLAEVVALDRAEVDTYLAVLVEVGFLRWQDDEGADRRVAFHSELVRESLLSDLDGDQRRIRHAVVASTLEERREASAADHSPAGPSGGPTAPSAIAAHYQRAGQPHNAIGWYERAGEGALEIYAHDDAVEAYRTALDLARELDDRERVLDIAESLTDIYATVGDFDRAQRYAEYVRERAEDPERSKRVLAELGKVANLSGKPERAMDLAREGLALAEEPSTRADGELLIVKAGSELNRSEYDAGVETAERIHDLGADLGDHYLQAIGERYCGLAGDDTDDSLVHHQNALEYAREGDERREVAETLRGLGSIAWQRGDDAMAREYFAESLEIFREIGLTLRVADGIRHFGLLDLAEGDLEEAERRFRECAEMERRIGSATFGPPSLALVHAHRGEFDRARSLLADAIADARETDHVHWAGTLLGHRGWVDRELGRYGDAADALEEAVEIATDLGDPLLRADALAQRALLACDRDDPATAVADGDDAVAALEDASGFRSGYVRPLTSLETLAERLVDRGRTDAVEASCERVLAVLQERGAPMPEYRASFGQWVEGTVRDAPSRSDGT